MPDMPLPGPWKRRLIAAVAVVAAPAMVFLTFDALVGGGDRTVDRPLLVETLGRASHAAGAALRGAGERLRGAGVPAAPAAARRPEDGAAQAAPVRPAARVAVPFLVYHHVAVPEKVLRPADMAYYVAPDVFESQMATLEAEGFVSVSPDDVAAALKGGAPLPPKPVVITFDDDRESQFTAAFPSLRRHHLTATFYVFTNAIGRKGYLTWDQLKELKDAGMGIQSHSIFHPFLGKLDDAALRKELEDSKAVLEDRLGVAVTSFAYPFGLHEDRVVAAVEAAGYATARALRHAPDVGPDDLFVLPGYVVTGDAAAFAQIIAGERR